MRGRGGEHVTKKNRSMLPQKRISEVELKTHIVFFLILSSVAEKCFLYILMLHKTFLWIPSQLELYKQYNTAS